MFTLHEAQSGVKYRLDWSVYVPWMEHLVGPITAQDSEISEEVFSATAQRSPFPDGITLREHCDPFSFFESVNNFGSRSGSMFTSLKYF